MKLLLWMLSLLFLEQRSINAYNYCHNATNHCDKIGMKHFICQYEQELMPFKKKTKYFATIPDTIPMRDLILHYHNKYRDMIARGTLTTRNDTVFTSASRMRELIWDLELAYTARMHASTVSFKHSHCRSVARFQNVGENFAMTFSSIGHRNIKEILDLTLKPMFNEYMHVEDPDDLVASFNPEIHDKVAHFTLMVNDRISRVGCGIVAATDCGGFKKDGVCFFLTCHYDFTTMDNSTLYERGPPASNCKEWNSGVSSHYSYLCQNNGQIFSGESDGASFNKTADLP